MKKLFKVSVSKVYIMYLLLLTIFVIGTYSSYAYFTVNKEKKNAIKMVTGNLVGELKVDGEVSDKLVVPANTSKSFSIELINKNDRSARFNFYYKESLKEGVEVGYIQNDGYNTMPSESGVNLEANGTLGYYQKYRIKVKNNTSDSITIPLGYSVGLYYNDLTLPNDCHLFSEMKMNPNEPKLASNMIPVRYDGSNWVKADESNWYNYDNLEWANAVTVSSDVRDGYIKASAGTTISMDKINTMWVWIPRYNYTIGSEDGTSYYGKKGEFLTTAPTQALPGEIDVEFVDKNTKDKGSAKYKVSEGVSGWYTPPGFTFGDKELEGIWIGKFETSNKENCIGQYNNVNKGCDLETLTAQIKPNVTSWKTIRVSTLELISMGLVKQGNIYGFDQTTYDSHAAKNTEWALMAYLSQSKYGKLGNTLYTGENKAIYWNNDNDHITGCSAGNATTEDYLTCPYQYNDITSQGSGTGYAGGGASTTGNIYGIYDTSGGSWEYVMGNLKDPDKRSGNTKDLNSGYTGKLADNTNFEGRKWEEDKYYNFYGPAPSNTACTIGDVSNSPCIGHALYETKGWYGGLTHELGYISNPWYIRGGGLPDPNFKYSSIFALGTHQGQGNKLLLSHK